MSGGLAFPAGLALGLLVAPLVLLYFLKLRRRDHAVSSTLLWRRVLEDRRANAPWQRLRRHLLLLLQLLVLLLLVLAFAAPYRRAVVSVAGETVVVIDVSASMSARTRDGGASRLDEARALARRLFASVEDGRQAALVVAGPSPDVTVPLTSDLAALERGLATVRSTDAPASLSAALELAEALVKGRENGEVVLLTDAAFDVEPALRDHLERCRVVRVGEDDDAVNAGLVAVSLRPRPGVLDAWEVFAAVASHAETDGALTLVIESAVAHGDPTTWTWSEVTRAEMVLAPHETRAQVVAVTAGSGTVLRLRLVGGSADALAVDDEALLVVPRRAALRALAVSPSPFVLTRALGALDGVSVFEASSLPQDVSEFDVVILDGSLPALLPSTPMLAFVGASATAGSGAERSDRARVARWDRRHPVLRHVDLAGLEIARATVMPAPPGADVLVEGTSGPLAYAWRAPGGRAVAFGFGLLESDLPLRVAFPVLMADAVDWLTHRGSDDGVIPTGRAREVALAGDATSVTWWDAAGASHVLEQRGGSVRLPALRQAGLHRIDLVTASPAAVEDDGRVLVAAALLSPEESDLRAREMPISLEEKQPGGGARRVPGRQHLWPLAVLLALVALTAEWIVYHRRPA